MAPFERGGRPDVAHDGFEVDHGVLVGVGHPVRPHHRVVRDPSDPAGHRGRTADLLLFLENERTRSGVGGSQRGDHASATGSDDHDVES